MDSNRKITKKFTNKFGSKVINRQYFHIKTGLKTFAYVFCTLTEIEVVLSKTGQFDVVDLYKTRTKDVLLFLLFWIN